MTDEATLRAKAEQMTVNMAINLLHGVVPAEDFPGRYYPTKGRLFTGNGKWTTLAAIGVANGFIAQGLAEEVMMPRPKSFSGYGPVEMFFLTPLGVEVGQYVQAHFDDLTFRDPPKRR